MNKKYLFLDIDGVLNSYFGRLLYENFIDMGPSSIKFKFGDFNPSNMEVLKFITNNIDINIIIASSWRISIKRLKFINDAFDYYNIDKPIGFIRDLQTEDESFSKEKLVERYIKENNIDLKDIVILDDEWYYCNYDTGIVDLSKPLMSRFVHVNPHDGLNYACYETICGLFNITPTIKIR